MRTTLTLEPELAKKLRQLAYRRGTSFKQVLNDAIRRGLSVQLPTADVEPFTFAPHRGGAFQPGIDPTKLNQLFDQIEVEHFLAKTKQ
jgi:hypothetical protein